MTAEMPQFDSFECPSIEIAAYIDGELDQPRELELEQHFAVCDVCALELRHQKQFLCSLSSSLMNEIELPANFTKTIVANAESSVAGLRRPRERFNAVLICAALFMFGLFALGGDAGNVFGRLTDMAEKATAVAGFFGHVAYSFFLGVGIVMRSLSVQAQIPAAVSFLSAVLLFLLFLLLSRRLIRFRRT